MMVSSRAERNNSQVRPIRGQLSRAWYAIWERACTFCIRIACRGDVGSVSEPAMDITWHSCLDRLVLMHWVKEKYTVLNQKTKRCFGGCENGRSLMFLWLVLTKWRFQLSYPNPRSMFEESWLQQSQMKKWSQSRLREFFLATQSTYTLTSRENPLRSWELYSALPVVYGWFVWITQPQPTHLKSW
jgi:hypothetical protein